MPPPVPQGQWAAPPPQQPQQPAGWSPQPGAPGGGGVPPAAWNPAPAKSGNGCLKACLIVGIILVVLAVLAGVAVMVLGMRLASDLGVNPDGSMKSCELISNKDLSSILGGDAQAMPMQGLVDATIGQVLDKRVLAQAQDCWLVGDTGNSNGYTGRLARQDDGNASSIFKSEHASAQSGDYLAQDMSGVGDEAFCTGVSEAMSVGVLARAGNRLVYVSLINGSSEVPDLVTTDTGVLTSPSTCDMAAKVAAQMLR